MPLTSRTRQLAAALVTFVVIAVAACSRYAPNSTLTPHSEFGREIDHLWQLLLLLGTAVFILVEVALLYAVFRYRRRPNTPEPEHVHGNTTLEVTWTFIPAVILAFIAVPTVRTIFRTQAKAVPNALQVEVIGHQWWWEFRYPQYNVSTANDLYLPVGRTANFALKSKDVIHSFWIPELAGKRDVVTNHTNYLWFTPESTYAWLGECAEYCGASHANMMFHAFTVTPAEFDRWIAHQKTGPAFAPVPPARTQVDTGAKPVSEVATSTGTTTPAAAGARRIVATANTDPATGVFPKEKLPPHLVPTPPIPAGLEVPASVKGDPVRGAQLFRTGACIGCHSITGISFGVTGPNLTHVGSRSSIAAGTFPNNERYLRAWIKNAPKMKPGALMIALGRSKETPNGYTDQQIADIAAYLLALK